MSRSYDIVVIGAGIVGLATALEASRRYPDLRLLVLEKEPQVAAHQTGRNSGVIHSGLYYKPGSLKATMCVAGATEMVAFCRQHGIPHEICGKVVVATERSEFTALEELHRRGQANGVPGLRMLDADEIKEHEPHAVGLRGLLVPGTGITDYSLVAAKYVDLIRQAGGEVQTNAEVISLTRSGEETVLETKAGAFSGRYIVNCAGLQSDRVARMANAKTEVQIVPFRGEYYEVVPSKHHLVRGLIYPVPDARFPFLGVHFTRRIHGGVEAGPNAVLALKREGYTRTSFDFTDAVETLTFPGFWKMSWRFWRPGLGEYYRSFSKPAFVRALQKLLPELGPNDVASGGAGVRAQALDHTGKLVDDFRFVYTGGMVHVCNVPSPAATASLIIGRAIVDMAQEHFSLKATSRTTVNVRA